MHVMLVDEGGPQTMNDLVSHCERAAVEHPYRCRLLYRKLSYLLTQPLAIGWCDLALNPYHAAVGLGLGSFDLLQRIEELSVNNLEVVAVYEVCLHEPA